MANRHQHHDLNQSVATQTAQSDEVVSSPVYFHPGTTAAANNPNRNSYFYNLFV